MAAGHICRFCGGGAFDLSAVLGGEISPSHSYTDTEVL